MKQLHDYYTREIHDALGYFAAWPPGAEIALGDVGLISGRRFWRETSLTELGVGFTTGSPAPMGNLEYTTKGLVEVSTKADSAVPCAAASVSITFSASGATFFQAGNCKAEIIENLPALGRDLARTRRWNRRYVVITEIVRSGPIVVLVSSEDGATADLRMSSDASPGSPLFVDAQAGLGFTKRKGFAAHLAKDSGATPLFQAMSLRKRPSRGALVFRNEAPADNPVLPDTPATGMVFRRLTWNDFATDM